MKASNKEPRCFNSGALFVRLLPEIPYNFKPLDDDQPRTRACGADDINPVFGMSDQILSSNAE
jgi:hypothetical protein